jgi:diguanylate cyclase (GGDEF)-like protein
MNDIHILFVDDEPDVLSAISRLLRKESYIAHYAGNGQDALAIMAETLIHIIVTDVKMPGMDGLTLLRLIKESYPDTVRLALSACLHIGQLLPSINTGEIFRYITKPTRQEDLKSSLQDAINYIKIRNDHIAHIHELEEKSEKLEQALEQQQEVEKQLRRLAIKDDVTELYNRRFLSYSLEQLFDRCKHNGNDLSCLIIDLDHFKQINDDHGYAFGDFLLKEFASRLIKMISSTDLGFRFGGARFIVLMPNTTLEIAMVLGKTILDSCRSTPFVYEDQSITITVSIGAASLKRNQPQTPDNLIHLADRMLAGYKLALIQKY